MNTQKIVTSVLVAVALLFVVLYITKSSAPAPVPVTQQFGSAVGPESSNDYNCYIGTCTYYRRQVMRQATSTICSLLSPPATTTLAFASANFTTSASYNATYMMGTDSNAFGTTTSLIAGYVVTANNKATIQATSTSLVDSVIGPSTYVNLKISTTTASATYAPVGTCAAVFRGV